MENVTLTTEEYAVLCGLVQDSEDVEPTGIFVKTEVWASLRETFPWERFRDAVNQGVIQYDPEAGT